MEETPWNMALLYFVSLDKIWKEKDEAYMNGDVFKWYFGLKAIFHKIVFKLSKKEEEELQNLFNSISEDLSKLPHQLRDNSSKKEFVKSDAEKSLSEVDKTIVKLLDKYNMIFPNIKNITGMDKITNRYGLQR